MATYQLKSSKEESDAKQGQGFLYVKVSMDGAPYLRKVNIKTYKNYKELSLVLKKMFVGFSTGRSGSNGLKGKDGASEGRNDGEFVPTYKDKDGDRMLVGDVPWKGMIGIGFARDPGAPACPSGVHLNPLGTKSRIHHA